MKRLFFALIFFLIFLSCKRKEEKPLTGTPVARVGNIYITPEDLEKGLPQFAYQMMREEQRREFLNYVLDLVIFSLAAEKEKIHEERVMKERLLWARRIVLSDEYFRRKTQHIIVTQSEVDSFYREYENDFLKEIEFVYFFVNSMREAEEIKLILEKSVFSKDVIEEITSKYNALGDLTSVNAGFLHFDIESALAFPKEIAHALLNLQKGKVSEVISVRNPPSFAVVKVLASSPTKLSKQDIMNEIREYLYLKKIVRAKDSLREELKKSFPVEIYSKGK